MVQGCKHSRGQGVNLDGDSIYREQGWMEDDRYGNNSQGQDVQHMWGNSRYCRIQYP